MGQGGRVAERVARGDVRLYRFAPPDKQRPVVVLTRDSIIDRLARVTVAPVTSTIRGGSSPSRPDLRRDRLRAGVSRVG